jgi:drug/metabolite transporter (DMT)-like permease
VAKSSSINQENKTDNLKTAAALVAANFFFGTNIIAVKKISPLLIDPLGLSFARMFITAILLISIPIFIKEKEKIEKKDYLILIIAGLLGVTCNQIFSITGISKTNPIHASLLIMATPIIVSVLAAIFLHEKFGWNKMVGLFFGISGASILITSRTALHSGNPASLSGDIFIVLGAFCYSIYLILIRKISSKYKPLTILRFVFIFGTIFSIPLCAPSFYNASWNDFHGLEWYAIFHIIMLGTFLSYLLMNMGVSKWGPSKTGSYIYFQPLFGTAAAVLILNETLTMIKIAAGCLIVVGVWVTSLQRRK